MGCDHATCLEVYANELRLELAKILAKGPKNVSELTKTTGAERSRVSHALLELKKCHVIKANKKGRTVTYELNKHTPITQKGTLLELVEGHRAHNCATCHKE